MYQTSFISITAELKRLVAERVGFEPARLARRLADFESAPLGLLGTFPAEIDYIMETLSGQ